MADFQNRQPAEGINTSTNKPLLTFLKLMAGMIAVLFMAAWLLGQAGGYLAGWIPFDQELRLSKTYESFDDEAVQSDNTAPELQAYLNDLADRLTPAMHLPDGMTITVHYQGEDVENAFATIGGHVLLYKGLLKALPNENSLAMLIAHEMAHVKLRHPIRSAGQGLAINSGIKLLMGYSNVDVLGNAGLYTQLHFSRTMETDADTEGLAAIHAVYGHVSGATDLFATLNKLHRNAGMDTEGSAFFSTHPLDAKRIAKLEHMAQANGWLSDADQTTPLPEDFHRWLNGD